MSQGLTFGSYGPGRIVGEDTSVNDKCVFGWDVEHEREGHKIVIVSLRYFSA